MLGGSVAGQVRQRANTPIEWRSDYRQRSRVHVRDPVQAGVPPSAAPTAQQGSPAPPHSSQAPLGPHVSPLDRQVAPQQDSPAWPHAWHTLVAPEPEPALSHWTAWAVHPTEVQHS